ncbi:MAG: hypothetical protein AABZ15_00080 [Nitrospirota bacterium]
MLCPLTGEQECKKKIEPDIKLFFFGFPYLDSFEDVELTVTETMKEFGFIPYTARDEVFLKHILCKVCNKMQESSFGIFELTDRNPNVMYELGMMGGMGKHFVIIARKGTTVPSDLGGIEFIEYKSCQDLKKKLVHIKDAFKKIAERTLRDIQNIPVGRKADSTATSFSLPDILPSTTYNVETGCGSLHISISKIDGKPVKVHAQMSKSGGCAASMTDALSSMVSAALQYNVPVDIIIQELKGVRCPAPAWGEGGSILSCADAIARKLELDIRNSTKD